MSAYLASEAGKRQKWVHLCARMADLRISSDYRIAGDGPMLR
jgi:hypothetical protein